MKQGDRNKPWRVFARCRLKKFTLLRDSDGTRLGAFNIRDITMAQIAKWFERKFEFSFPVELYPDLCMRLRGTPARLEEMCGDVRRERMVRAS